MSSRFGFSEAFSSATPSAYQPDDRQTAQQKRKAALQAGKTLFLAQI
jgi:hypothetical protein